MPGINKVILIGNLGSNPELKYSSNGNSVAIFFIATSETWKDKSGQKQEKTEWHRISVFGKLAEIVEQYYDKGTKAYIEGKLETRKYQKDGQDHYATGIIVGPFHGVVQNLGSAGGTSSNTDVQFGQSPNQPSTTDKTPITPVDNSGFDDDIPF